jgi:uncharacterized protein (TIGR02453 family)
MLQATTLQFLSNLKNNNNRDWFLKNKKAYEAAKQNFEDLTTAVLEQLAKNDNNLTDIKPKDCLFRINRDVRFSKDKSPYKTNFGMGISKGGKKSMAAGYYLHCEPGNAFIGGGLWMPMAPELKKIRQEIDYCWPEFASLLKNKKFKETYTDLNKNKEYTLSRPPKDYEATNPAIEYLKLKSYVATKPLADAELLNKNLVKNIVAHFETLKPVVVFINRGIEQ